MNFKKINFLKTLFQKHPKTILCLALCILTIAAYWPVKNYPFINYDDGPYVYDNSHVKSGLSIQNIIWAFDIAADEDKHYWHPLTSISHMIDIQLFGLNPHMHHLSNLFFHTLNTILLFLVFSLMTGDAWKCFFMATLFAIHPMNIESTAWIAERKNLLSTMFWMLTMLAYIFYAKKPAFSRYLLVFLAFGCGLLAKPILVVLPFVLLLMDFWPLKRTKWADVINTRNNHDNIVLPKSTFGKMSNSHLILEKTPLLLLSFMTFYLSMVTLQGKSEVINTAIVPLMLRIENAIVSYVIYLKKMIWPIDLAFFYPFPDAVPTWQTIGAIIFLCLMTYLATIRLKTKPYLIIGWLWFLGVLFPASGLIQGGHWPALADRWAYVPLIGIFIIFAWGVPDILPKWRYRRTVLSVSATCLIIFFLCVTRNQLAYWADSYTLFNRAIAVTENNFLAYSLVGKELIKTEDYKTAEKYFLTALRIKPDYADTRHDIGHVAYQNKEYDKALKYYRQALLFRPSDAKIMCIIADLLIKNGNLDEAIDYYSEALVLNPSVPDIYNKIGMVFYIKQAYEKARQKFKMAVRLNPEFYEAYYNLGLVALKQGKLNDALNNYKEAISINPNYTDALKSLGDLLFSRGHMADAFKYYSQVVQINPEDAKTHYNIGVILYQQRQIQAADDHFYKAVQLDASYEKARVALAMTRNILGSEKR